MKDRDVEDPAMSGDSLPDGNGPQGLEPDERRRSMDDERDVPPLVPARKADLSRSPQARKLPGGLFGRRGKDRAERAERPQPPATPASVPASSRLAEYVRTRGVRGKLAPQEAVPQEPDGQEPDGREREPRSAARRSLPAQAPALHAPRPVVSSSGSDRLAKTPESDAKAQSTAAATATPGTSARLTSPHPLASMRGAGRSSGVMLPGQRRRRVRSQVRGWAFTRSRVRDAILHPGRRAVFGLTGAATTLALVGALVVVLPNQHPAATPSQRPGSSVYGVAWSAAGDPPKTRFDFGPYFARAGATLYMAGTAGTSTSIWASSDGSSWTQTSDPSAFGIDGRRFVAQGLSDDGQGGLVMIGNSVGAGAADVVATAWRSQDGRSWSRATIDAASGQEMIGGVAALPGKIVAAGNGIAWFSTDGSSWKPVAVPAAQAFIPREVGSWPGGFVIVSLASGASTTRSAVWYSKTGLEWTQSSTVLDGFDARAIAGGKDRIMVVGSDTSATAEGMAVSWTSQDGDKWTKATATTTQTSAAMDGVTVFGGSFIAVGAPDGASAVQAAPSASPAPVTEDTWISDDGAGWLSLTTPITPVPRGHLTSVGGKLVLGGSGTSGTSVLTGTASYGPFRVATVSATPATVYSLDLTAGQVPMIPDVATTDTLGPVVATNDRFVLFTTGGAGTSIWTSTDGGHLWAREAKADTLAVTGNTGRPVILKAIADGKGGVLAIGSVTDANGSTGTIWHRTGAGWHQVTIQDEAPPQFSSIAAGQGNYVATSDKAGGSPVMYSTDGENWYASSITVGDGFALTVGTYQYGFVAVGTNAARGGSSAAWTSADGRTWTLRTDWKLPPNVTALFGVGKYLAATSTMTPGAPAATPLPSPLASASPTSKTKPKATPKPTPTPAAAKPYTQWWWSGSGQSWQQTSLQTSTMNYALVNNEIFVIDPPSDPSAAWTTRSSADGRIWISPVSDPVAFEGGSLCTLAALGNKLVIVGWQAPGQLKGYFGKLTSQ